MPAELAKPDEEEKEPETEIENETKTTTPKKAPAKPMVGIIYPPPEVRNIVDKTAGFVARNGPEFEGRIRQNEVSNAKFNFLNPGDPYHAYYRHKVKDFMEGKTGNTNLVPTLKIAPPKPITQAIEATVPKDPPPTFEFVADPPSINTFELDIVKLTAQFVARNGRQFLTNLMNKESRNYSFDFLRPQHSMFNYFTKLVEQYTKVLIPPKGLPKKLRSCDSMKVVLSEVHYRVEWEKLQEKQRRKEEEARERERVAYSQIDWHNFVVVEMVDYRPDEQGQFPPPIKQDEVGSRVIAEERFEQFGETLAEEEDVEMEVEDEDDESESDSDESSDSDEEEGEGEKKKAKPKKKEKPVSEDKEDEESDESEEEADEDEKADDNAEDGDDEDEVVAVAAREKLSEDAATPPMETKDDQNTEIQDMDEGDSDMEESDDEEDRAESKKADKETTPSVKDIPMPPPLPPQPDEVQIRKDYDPKAPKVAAAPGTDDNYLVSPITGMKIPADKMQEHMRIGLLDQRWMEQRSQNIERAKEEEVFAAGESITENLKKLAERRTDIFGEGDVETQIGKKIGEEEDPGNKQKVIWDGHSASMESTTRKAQANISIEDQIEALHKAQGLLPDKEKERIGPQKTGKGRGPRDKGDVIIRPPPKPKAPPLVVRPPVQRAMPPLPPPPAPIPHMPVMAMPARPPMMPQPGLMVRPMMGGPPMGMPRPPPPMGPPPPRMMPPPPPQPPFPPGPGDSGEPHAKRQKTEDSLIPELHFLSMNRGPVSFRVLVPSMADKPEWKLNGQMVPITMPLTDQISVLKAKIFEEIGMPAGKQKLQYEGMFVKDSNSLAFYNVMRGSVVQLQVKERGGRKR